MKKILVIYGGTSSEHEISILSAQEVVKYIDREKFSVDVLGQCRNGTFRQGKASSDRLAQHLDSGPIITDPIALIRESDVVFPMLHGPGGEDGSIQGLFEVAGTAYVGSGVLACAMGMDKAIFKRFVQGLDDPFSVVPWLEFQTQDPGQLTLDDADIERISNELGFPCFVKPANLGSAIGIQKINSAHQLRQAGQHASQYDLKVIVERGVNAREIEVAVLGNGSKETLVSTPGEICLPEGSWYDYDNKYISAAGKATVPADLPPSIISEVQQLALSIFRQLGCRGLARVDFFVERGSDHVYLNEINTMPGFTSISMFPMMIAHANISYQELLTRLISLALEHHQTRKQLKRTL